MTYEKELMILVGPIGSGKTTFAKTLRNDTSVRISQDEMGRKAYLDHFKEAIKDGVPRVIIDRMGFSKDQRNRFIEPARKEGYVITIFEMDYCPLVCIKRVVDRKNHPTVPDNDIQLAKKIILQYMENYEAPEPEEFDNYNLVGMNEQV